PTAHTSPRRSPATPPPASPPPPSPPLRDAPPISDISTGVPSRSTRRHRRLTRDRRSRSEPTYASISTETTAHASTATSAPPHAEDRKSTRLNSSHAKTPYAASCLKQKTSPPPRPR